MAEKIQVILILEILGKPEEYIKNSLTELVEKIGKEENVNLINKSIAEPKKVEGEENWFTTFAEVEIETTLQKLLNLIYSYMPAHIEIIYPENIEIKNFDMNNFLNELARRLHQYDELARRILIEREILAKQIQEGKLKLKKEESAKKKKSKKNKRKKAKSKKK